MLWFISQRTEVFYFVLIKVHKYNKLSKASFELSHLHEVTKQHESIYRLQRLYEPGHTAILSE